MGTIKDEANAYKPKATVKNISELEFVDVSLPVLEDLDAEFPYKYVEVANERYKVPKSVLSALQAIQRRNPNLKSFSVDKSGEGMDTRYVVIPLN